MARRIFDRLPARRRGGPTEWSPVDDPRPRVLIEAPHHATPSLTAQLLERAGFDSVVCDGPGDDAGRCELLASGSCSLVEGADVVYNAFGLATEEHREIVAAVRRCRPDVPLVVEATRPRAEAHAELLDGCVVCTVPVSSRELVTAVADAVADAARPGA